MKVKVGICQLEVNSNKDINYENMQSSVNKLVLEDVKIVILPECWNCPYGIEYFQECVNSRAASPFKKLEKLILQWRE